MKQNLLTIVVLLLMLSTVNAQQIDLITHAVGLQQPVDIANAGDERLFIVEQEGTIRIVEENGTVLTEPFLDITDDVRSSGQEQGLLGLAFHPDYASNGFFYVNYTNPNGDTYIARYTVSSSNPNIANPNSRFIIYTVSQPYNNHNGGDLNFGPDGYLYIALGDGGSGGDPGNRAQNMTNPLGKILRIDIDSGVLYGIPPDNPFAQPGQMGLDEIWALGLRNPWRFSFDAKTGDMWISDVGQDEWEEINFQPAASVGGENYGWRCYEGLDPFNPSGCSGDVASYTYPIHVYANNSTTSGCSVTGGYVYRGNDYPGLQGLYIYADYCTGRFWSIEQAAGINWLNKPLGEFMSYNYSSFGEDIKKELYVAGLSDGRIYRIVDPNALPIDLVSFTAENIDNKEVALKWLTATEIDSDYFDVQRSLEGVSFSTIGKVSAAGNSSTSQNYEFIDEEPAFGEIYYRLRQVDFDGSVTYSEILQVKLDRNYVTPNIYPNPVRSGESLIVDFGDIPNSAVAINIVDMSGKQVWQNQFDAGQNRFEIPVNELPRGMYIINGQFNDYYFYKKLIVH